MRSLLVARVAGLLGLLGLLASCTGTRDVREPGEKLGTFAVNGTLLATTCGEAAATFRYEVRLSREGSRLYWVQGSTTPIQATVDAQGRVQMVADLDVVVAKADARANVLGCTIHRTDTLAATLEGEPPRSFTGALVYKFSAASGDCADQLVSAGGRFATLPCTQTYDVNAAALER